jgi:hypothetical protein
VPPKSCASDGTGDRYWGIAYNAQAGQAAPEADGLATVLLGAGLGAASLYAAFFFWSICR